VLTVITENTNRSSHRVQQNTMRRREKHLSEHSLTTEELYQVNLATIREGINHRRWPREVIERFLLVEA
jgi:hypothetical protein